jgi:hypothetical protein
VTDVALYRVRKKALFSGSFRDLTQLLRRDPRAKAGEIIRSPGAGG